MSSPTPDPPSDPLSRFVLLYEALNAGRPWWGDVKSLRFAAMTAIACPGGAGETAGAIHRTTDEVRKRSGFGQLNSPLRFILSAILVQTGDDPGGFLSEVERVREAFRSLGLRRGGNYETIAILILRQGTDRRPIPAETVQRFQAVYEEMKRHHWWLTGPDDFPACALLVRGRKSPLEIGQEVEDIYQALLGAGFSSGDPLQTAAAILHLASLDAGAAAERYRGLAEGFREAGVSIWKSDYDELAILSFLDFPAQRVVERVLEHRKAMEALRPRPDRSLTFNLAAQVAFLDLLGADRGSRVILDAKARMDMQAFVNAQRAAAAAAAGAAC